MCSYLFFPLSLHILFHVSCSAFVSTLSSVVLLFFFLFGREGKEKKANLSAFNYLPVLHTLSTLCIFVLFFYPIHYPICPTLSSFKPSLFQLFIFQAMGIRKGESVYLITSPFCIYYLGCFFFLRGRCSICHLILLLVTPSLLLSCFPGEGAKEEGVFG